MDTEKKQLELDKRYIRMASIWAENSYCQRRKGRSVDRQRQNDYLRRIQWYSFGLRKRMRGRE